MEAAAGFRIIGEVHYVKLDNGRVKCIETGHEMPEAHAKDYASTKKCKAALFDKALAESRPLKKFFRQSPTQKDKIVCAMTGAVLNKTEEAVWKHMTGKKFMRALDSSGPGRCEEDEAAGEKGPCEEDAAAEEKGHCEEDEVLEEEEGGALPDLEDSEPDFWVPPVGDRWDMDDGGDRWASSSSAGTRMVSSRRIEGICDEEEEGVAAMEEVEDEAMDITEGNLSPDNEPVRMKRTALALGPTNGKKKKKRKATRNNALKKTTD